MASLSVNSFTCALPRTPESAFVASGQMRLSYSRSSLLSRGDGLRLRGGSVAGWRRGLGGCVRTRAAFISPPAEPQYLNAREREDMQDEVLGSVPVAPRGPKRIITWRLVAGLLWKQKLRLALAAFALVAATTCTLTMPLFSGPPRSGSPIVATGANNLVDLPLVIFQVSRAVSVIDF